MQRGEQRNALLKGRMDARSRGHVPTLPNGAADRNAVAAQRLAESQLTGMFPLISHTLTQVRERAA